MCCVQYYERIEETCVNARALAYVCVSVNEHVCVFTCVYSSSFVCLCERASINTSDIQDHQNAPSTPRGACSKRVTCSLYMYACPC